MEGISLPEGWIKYTDSIMEDILVFAKLTINVHPLSAKATMLLKLDKELRWSLSCNGVSVEVGQCSLLSDIPPKLTSVNDVINLLSTFKKNSSLSWESGE